MSRWQDEHNSLINSEAWNNICEYVEHIKTTDIPPDHHLELARFKRIWVLIATLTKNIDPELVRISQYHQLKTVVNAIQHSLRSNDFEYFNARLDDYYEIIQPFILSDKNSAQAAGRAFKKYNETINEALKSFQTEKSKVQSALETTQTAQKRITEYSQNLFGKDGQSDDGGIKAEIEKANKDAQELLHQVEQHLNELEKVSKTLLGKQQTDGSFSGGLKDELEVRKNTLSEFENEQKEKFNALNSQIQSLLPGATSAGLASSFKKLKDERKGQTEKAGRIFFGCIAALIFVNGTILAENSEAISEAITSPDINAYSYVTQRFIAFIPLMMPIIWLAYFSLRRRNENNRLYEEYAHKEALAMSFESYKEQIDKLGEKENILNKKLLETSINELKQNPASTLDKASTKKFDKKLSQTISDLQEPSN